MNIQKTEMMDIYLAKLAVRFYSGSNRHLQCANCTDRTCQIKNAIAKSAKTHNI